MNVMYPQSRIVILILIISMLFYSSGRCVALLLAIVLIKPVFYLLFLLSPFCWGFDAWWSLSIWFGPRHFLLALPPLACHPQQSSTISLGNQEVVGQLHSYFICNSAEGINFMSLAVPVPCQSSPSKHVPLQVHTVLPGNSCHVS